MKRFLCFLLLACVLIGTLCACDTHVWKKENVFDEIYADLDAVRKSESLPASFRLEYQMSSGGIAGRYDGGGDNGFHTDPYRYQNPPEGMKLLIQVKHQRGTVLFICQTADHLWYQYAYDVTEKTLYYSTNDRTPAYAEGHPFLAERILPDWFAANGRSGFSPADPGEWSGAELSL